MWRKFKISFLSIFLLLSGCIAPQPDISLVTEPPTPSQIFQNSINKVALIATIDQQSTGAGAMVTNGNILTNWHIVRGSRLVWVAFYNPNYSYIEDYNPTDWKKGLVIKIDQAKDLALISIFDEYMSEDIPSKSIKIDTTDSFNFGNSKELKIGQDMYSISHPQGHIFSFSKGLVSKLPDSLDFVYELRKSKQQIDILERTSNFFGFSDTVIYNKEYRFTANAIQMQFPKNEGSSGGPILDTQGKLIGINSTAKREGEGLSFAIRIDEIKSFLASDSTESVIE